MKKSKGVISLILTVGPDCPFGLYNSVSDSETNGIQALQRTLSLGWIWKAVSASPIR